MKPEEWTIAQARAALAGGAISCVEYVDALLAQARRQTHLNALVAQDETALLAAAASQDADGKRVPTFATYIRNTDPGSTAGIPGISLPIGLTPQGLPVALELDGPPGSDPHLIAVAAAIERTLPAMPAPPR